MKFYIHPLNPNYTSSYLEDYNEGWTFGIWDKPWPALESDHYLYQSKHLQASQETCQQAQDASKDIPDIVCDQNPLVFPASKSLWGHEAQAVIRQAIEEGRPVDWCLQERLSQELAR